MTTFGDGKRAPAGGPVKVGRRANTSEVSAQGATASARYYFNLTNGETTIRDEEGILASSIQAAVGSAVEAVEELRAQDPSNSDEWQGWQLEIVDASGQALQTIPLDVLSAH